MQRSNTEWTLIALLCGLTVAPRLYHFTAPPVDGQSVRQGLTAAIIRDYVERDHNFLHPQIDIMGENRWTYVELPVYEYRWRCQ